MLYPDVESLSISHAITLAADSVQADTVTLALLTFKKPLKATERPKLSDWLHARTGSRKLKLIVE